MRIRTLLVVLLPVAAALAGCAEPGASSDEPPADSAGRTSSDMEQLASKEAYGGGGPPPSDDPPASSGQSSSGNGSASSDPPAASGGNATQESGSEPPAASPPPGPRKREETGTGKVTAAVAPPCAAPEVPCPGTTFETEPVTLPIKEAGPALVTLVVEWDAQTAPLGLTFNVTTPDDVHVGSGSGASPLTITLDPALLAGAKEILVTPEAPSPGAAGNVEYSLLLTLEYR